MKTEKHFPDFWYESNPIWGWVRSLEDLCEKARYQLEENNCIETLDDFLDISKQCHEGGSNYGTRREHYGEKTLRELLIQFDLLDDFLTLYNQKNGIS
jgi:hypothetical protein